VKVVEGGNVCGCVFLTSFETVLRCFSSKRFSTTSFELKYVKMNLDRYFFLPQTSGNFLYSMDPSQTERAR